MTLQPILYTDLTHNCGLLRFDFDFDETFKYSLFIRQNSLELAKCFAIISVSKGGVSLLIEELIELANKICKQKAEEQTFVNNYDAL